MSKFQKWLILVIVSSALFLIVIDMTVLYAALPRLTYDLQATASDKLWIVNAYSLVMAGLLLGTGTLGDRVGHKRLFMIGLVIFGLATLVAAFSRTPLMLIFGRVFLAVGASIMMPATLSLIRITFTDETERSMAIGIWASVAAGGAGLGPLIGGFLLEYFWWGSVFLINIPVVVLSLVAGWYLIPDSAGNPSKPWDVLSSFLIMMGLVGLVYAIKEITVRDANYGLSFVALIIGVIGLVLFVDRQKRLTYPLVDFALFKNRLILAGVLTAMFSSGVNLGFKFALTQRLQLVEGLTPFEAGLFLVGSPIASFFAGIFAGWALPRVGSGKMLWGTLLLACVGLCLFALTFNSAPYAVQFVTLMVVGAGIGAASTTASNSIMNHAPIERAGMAASVEEVSYELGGAVGIAILGSAMSFLYTASFQFPESLNAVAPIVRDSLDEAIMVAETLPQAQADLLLETARASFDQGFMGVIVFGIVLLITVIGVVGYSTRNVIEDKLALRNASHEQSLAG
jgi:DHA2 family multidrug resistance protein-like MFS transporter